MLRSFSYGLLAYMASAAVFLGFSVFFVRSYGSDTYGEFSLLLNTVSALTLFGNYHGGLVAYAPAIERRAFRAMLRPVLVYAAGTAVIAAAVLSSIGGLDVSLFAVVTIAFVFIVASGLPSAAVAASPANWMASVARAAYQSLLILAFWALFALEMGTSTAFALAFLLAAAVYLAILSRGVRFQAAVGAADPAPRFILLIAACWNLALMCVMLTDKFAIRFLNVGADAADVGVFLLYLDIVGRFSAIYVIGLAPLTYELLRRIREGSSIRRTAGTAIAACLVVGLAVTLVGYYLIPPLYNIGLAGRDWLPGAMGVYVTLLGFASLFLAYCNSAGKQGLLLRHYIGVFVTGSVAIGVLYFAGGRHISVTALALALILGQCFLVASVGFLARRRRAAHLDPAVPARDLLGVFPVGKAPM